MRLPSDGRTHPCDRASRQAGMTDTLFSEAFALWGGRATWAEVLGFALAVPMVLCNIRAIHWGWPLAALSSLLYLLVFWHDRLYGEAVLQIFFALMALWGWRQWLHGQMASGEALRIAPMTWAGRAWAALACGVLWPLLGLFLGRYTDTDVPWWDAWPTALSVVAQYLLARKHPENWLLWLAVNIVSLALFAHKGLWLTTALYALFTLLSVVGWRAWTRESHHA